MIRKTLLSLTAFAGLLGAATAASAAPVPTLGAPVAAFAQPVQYYEGGYDPRAAEWQEREWRRHEWERHRRWEEEHRWHEAHRFGW